MVRSLAEPSPFNAGPTAWLRSTLDQRHVRQLGTLGGGNHFVELVVDDATPPRCWVMLHSGSRNIGHTTASHYGRLAKKATGDRDGLEYMHIESPAVQKFGDSRPTWRAYEFLTVAQKYISVF